MLIVRVLCGIFAAGSISYLLLALYHVLRYRPSPTIPTFFPKVTVLVPVCGLSPRLAECLASICRQHYPTYHVIFGLHTADDAARPVIEQLIADLPDEELTLVIDNRRIGANPKNSNLANMLAAAKHEILVMVDSDVLVAPGFLAAIVQPLADPTVGGVSCVYKASPEAGLPAQLGALFINDWLTPSVLVDTALYGVRMCYAAAIAIPRRALDDIGGFAAMSDAVAQDFVLGSRLRAQGYALRLAPVVVDTVAGEQTLSDLFFHELRWNRSVRAARWIDHALWIVTSPLLPLAILLVAWPLRLAAATILFYAALRLSMHALLRLRFVLPPTAPWLLPLREMLNFAVWLWAFFGREIRWGDAGLVTGNDQAMRPVEDSAASTVDTTAAQSRSGPG